MTEDPLTDAMAAAEAASRAATDGTDRALLDRLADQLRTQAERSAPPALGTLDRIDHYLAAVEDRTEDEAVADRVAAARGNIRTALASLDDRGMSQHGRDPQS